ncbi:MAG: hypothetical protein J0L52_01290 [Caulobacterales bacterium]|nr:hypothetical protein [Caulobacterales bacterium]
MANLFLAAALLSAFVGVNLRVWALRSEGDLPPMTPQAKDRFDAQTRTARIWIVVCWVISGVCGGLYLLLAVLEAKPQ